MNYSKLFAQNSYLVLNKDLMRLLGINEALLLSELCSQTTYFEEHNQLDEEGFFYCTAEQMEENIVLNYYEQKKALVKLEELNLVETKVKGVPAKKHYKVNDKEIVNFLEKNLRTSSLNFKELDFKNLKTNNNRIIVIDNSKSNKLDLQEKNSKKSSKILDNPKTLVNSKKPSKKELKFQELLGVIQRFFIDEEIVDLLIRYLNSKKEAGRLPTVIAFEDSLLELKQYNKQEIIKAIEDAIRGEYKTFYPKHINNGFLEKANNGLSRDGISYDDDLNEEKLRKSQEAISKLFRTD